MKTLLSISLLVISTFSFGQNFKFTPDSGVRLDSATTRNAKLINDTMFLYYGQELDTNGSVFGLAISVDKPDYLTYTTVNINDYPLHNFHTLPNGLKRRYTFDQNLGYLKSETSTDWQTAVPDTGSRYNLHSSDNGIYGVSSYYNDSSGGVHIVYIGDIGGVDNTRHAYSADSGWTFTFLDGDVCGDSNGLGGNYSYWDPFALVNPDNSVRIFTMNAHGITAPPHQPTGHIYTFLSTDNGMTFTREVDAGSGDSIRISYDDFPGIANTSLNDPKAVNLPDGRIRLFVNGLVQQPDSSYVWQILSATLLLPLDVDDDLSSNGITVYPNPANDFVRIDVEGKAGEHCELKMLDIFGRVVGSREDFQIGHSEFDLREFSAGVYWLRMEFANAALTTKLIIE